jgi:hypothetical protein
METSPLSISGLDALAEQFALSLQVQRDHACEFLAVQQTRLQRAELLVQQQIERLEAALKAERDDAERLRAQRDAMAARLAQAESRPTETEKRPAETSNDDRRSADKELHDRYDAALDELRELKARNATLQEQLAKARSTATNLARQPRPPGWLDWEAEKQRIVALLEADFDPNDPQQHDERLRIEDVLQITEQLLANKDREIQELKQHLEEHRDRAALGDPAAIDRALNSNAAVQQERERLKRLQEEWREKLRGAEVEMSLERAKLARQRAQLEEQLRSAENNSSTSPKAADAAGPSERPVQGRWMARMGLTEADKEPKRQ